MARYEFSEGNSNKFWEATLDGTSLTVRFGKIGTNGQTQVKQFTTPDAAKKEHDKLVAEKTKKGYALAGGSAPASSAPAAKPPASPPKKKGAAPAEASLRKDLYCYNEATGFLITSKRLGGKGWDSESEEWDKAVRNGDLIPTELVQDDPFTIRVVVGGTLLPQEAEEWTGRLDWKLRVPDGNLVVCGGSEYVMEDWDDDEDFSEYVRHVKIPRGEYKASLYMYLGGVNGKACMVTARGGDEPDPLGEWFRRTRPKEEFPAWLHNDCVLDPTEDPGHEKEWKDKKQIDDPNESYVEFLIHLTPLKEGEAVAMPELGDGWFSVPTECRVPEKIPLGIPAPDPEGLPKAPPPKTVIPIEVTSHVQRFKRETVKGGPVDVPIKRLDRLFRLAWSCHSWAGAQIHITPPDDEMYAMIMDPLENTAISIDKGVYHIGFQSDGGMSYCLRAIAAVAKERLDTLPDGSSLELDTVYNNPESMKADRPIGAHRYKGTVKGGVLRIEEAFPPVDAATLKEALALSAQVENETTVDAGSKEILDVVMKALKAHAFFSDNPAVVVSGTAIGLTKPEPIMHNYVFAEIFRRKYGKVWPAMNLDDDDEEDDEEEEKKGLASILGGRADRPMPPKGDVVLNGDKGRVFYLSDAMKMSDAVKARVAAIEKDILPMGFKHIADVTCKPLDSIVVRAYAQDGGSVCASLLMGVHGNGTFEFITKFQKGALLTVTTNATTRDELFRHAFKSARGGASVADLWKESQRRGGWLAELHGPPVTLVPTAKGLAEDIEGFISRQEAAAPAPGCELLATGENNRRAFSFDGKTVDAAAPAAIADADKIMKDLGYEPVGDAVLSAMFTSHVNRGYAKKGGDTWAKFVFEGCSSPQLTSSWEFVTPYANGAVLVSTRVAMSKDEPKRKIYRILEPKLGPRELLAKHDKRKAELITKHGATVPVQADMKGLGAEVELTVRRIIG